MSIQDVHESLSVAQEPDQMGRSFFRGAVIGSALSLPLWVLVIWALVHI
jgi:hypothetical protein